MMIWELKTFRRGASSFPALGEGRRCIPPNETQMPLALAVDRIAERNSLFSIVEESSHEAEEEEPTKSKHSVHRQEEVGAVVNRL